MNISNTWTPYQQNNVEDMVNTQKQEYPKPSIPPENVITTPVEKEYSAEKNEAKATAEADLKNSKQSKKEDEMNKTPSLNDMQTLALKTNVTQNKIEAYAAGAGVDINQDETYKSIKEYQNLQENIKKQNAVQEYQKLGLM